jgi:hypothetical protein
MWWSFSKTEIAKKTKGPLSFEGAVSNQKADKNMCYAILYPDRGFEVT